MGDPEAVGLMQQPLTTTQMPLKIATITHYMEKEFPGQYRQETINAVNDGLGMASKGQLGEWDVGPLFQLLQNYGGAAAVEALEQTGSKWKYYATLALAGLPSGEGLQSLIRQAQAPSDGPGAQNDFSFQML